MENLRPDADDVAASNQRLKCPPPLSGCSHEGYLTKDDLSAFLTLIAPKSKRSSVGILTSEAMRDADPNGSGVIGPLDLVTWCTPRP